MTSPRKPGAGREIAAHVYVEGARPNSCLWCGKSSERGDHISQEALLDGIEADWDVSEGQP